MAQPLFQSLLPGALTFRITFASLPSLKNPKIYILYAGTLRAELTVYHVLSAMGYDLSRPTSMHQDSY